MSLTVGVVIFVLMACIAIENWHWGRRDAMHCMRCHTQEQPEAAGGMRLFAGFCVLLGLVLMLFNWVFLLIALLALIARSQMPAQKCPACGSAELVPTNSPAAVAAVAAMKAATQAAQQKPQ